MATYNVELTVGPAVDEKLQRIFASVNEDIVASGGSPWATIEEWLADHLFNWGRGLWGEVVDAESEEVKTAYKGLSEKIEQNQVRDLLKTLGANIEPIP